MTTAQLVCAYIWLGGVIVSILMCAWALGDARRRIIRLEAELHQHIRNRGTHSNVYTGRRTTPHGGTQ